MYFGISVGIDFDFISEAFLRELLLGTSLANPNSEKNKIQNPSVKHQGSQYTQLRFETIFEWSIRLLASFFIHIYLHHNRHPTNGKRQPKNNNPQAAIGNPQYIYIYIYMYIWIKYIDVLYIYNYMHI